MTIKRFQPSDMQSSSSTGVEHADLTSNWAVPQPGFHVIQSFEFCSGETMENLRLHYKTIGNLKRDSKGRALNVVLIMHGTGGSSDQFLNNHFAGELFNPTQPLDAQKYFIILRDGIGHGQSSKPSDGLRARFPKYGYRDMVRADYELLNKGLGIDHLRLVMGTSMGGMQSWLWGGMYPNFMDAILPLASLPTQISGRNRMSRKMIIDAITSDPNYRDGEYSEQPLLGLTSALYILTWMSSIPLLWQKLAPDQKSADDFLNDRIQTGLKSTDANDLLYQVASSEDYDPRPLLATIKAPLVAINSADDQVNPPELQILEQGVKAVLNGRSVLIPISDHTRGHGSHTFAALWKDELRTLLEATQRTG
ncbi:homoserine O-acetyltransferase [Pochonia chlamydosporia 170]|uniref:Homoserine O-acetyltransferase n=1 Tax=Pochonia chlamydosporia 170 TaxID=1380566 RepID=A0A179F778_METCM|nr:homoserine O-acetyltransferase [Pochonia chlamydosporia 170]OAQ61257.1 homoserine O-acetyltransferase [Pochonia chlamydosporia 170]